MSHRLYLYPSWLRIWHWFNALLFLVLILTGASMHYAGSSGVLIPFETAVALHNICGVILTIIFFMFILKNLTSGNGRHYRPQLRGLPTRLFRQTRYYLWGIFRAEPHPTHATLENKFNPLQQLTYLGIMYGLVPLLIATGWLLFFPEKYPDKILGAGGVWPVAILHTILGYFGTLFMLGHTYLGTTGSTPTANFKGMITGWHEED